jgi:hypothetical protein
MDIEQRYPYFPFVEGWLNPNALKFTEYLVKQFVGENFSSLEIGVHREGNCSKWQGSYVEASRSGIIS